MDRTAAPWRRATSTAAAGADRSDRRQLVVVAVLVATLALLFGPGLLTYARFAADPWHFNDDARQFTWSFLRFSTPGLFRHDYIADYYLATAPRGYRLLFALSAPLVDPRTLGKLLPFIELLIVLYASIAAAWRLAGAAAAWGTGALLLSTDVFLARMAGGLPRSFAFPLVAVAVLALVRGKPWRLCAVAVLAAALYYPMAVLLGVIPAVYLLILPTAWRGDASGWSLRRRLGALCLTAVAAAIVALPAFVAARPFGPQVRREDVAALPEAGVGGRYDPIDLPIQGQLVKTAKAYAVAPLFSRGPAWNRALRAWGWPASQNRVFIACACAVILTGAGLLIATDVGARRLLVLLASAFAAYALSLALWPLLLLPSRYLAYTLPLLTCVAVPASLASLLRRLPGLRARQAGAGALVVAAVAALVLVLAGSGPGDAGLHISVAPGQRSLYAFLAELPADATIAGWPDDVIDNVPYLSERSILVGFETHQAYHRRYAEEMRRRMLALIDAYFAGDVGPLLRLRDEFGVTHLLINRTYLAGTPPSYFKPFDAIIADAVRSRPPDPAALHEAETAAVFADGPFVVLDLHRIDDSKVRAAPPP